MNVTTIIFDLDDTIYPASTGIWSLIRDRIDSFMISKLNYAPEKVSQARSELFLEFGTTLRGLQSIHQINPLDYLNYVHDIPVLEYLSPNLKLLNILNLYPQRKAIFTNADRWHANRILTALGIKESFHQIVDILDVTPFCKPMKEAFKIALDLLKIDNPSSCLMIDDSIKNISTAKEIGMQTLWISKNNQNNGSVDTPQIAIIEGLATIYPAEALN